MYDTAEIHASLQGIARNSEQLDKELMLDCWGQSLIKQIAMFDVPRKNLCFSFILRIKISRLFSFWFRCNVYLVK